MNDIFLATTALTEFWETSKPIVFLGDWCLLEKNKSVWSKLDYEVMTSVWSKNEDVEQAHNYLIDLNERLIVALTPILNGMHHKNYNERFWRIILAPWSFYYLTLLYDKYVFIKAAQAAYPDFISLGLSESEYTTPICAINFINLMLTDTYHLQLFTRVATVLGIDLPRRKLDKKNISNNSKVSISIIKLFKKIKHKLIINLCKFSAKSANLILVYSYFPPLALLHFWFKSKFKVSNFICSGPELKKQELNISERDLLKNTLNAQNEFEQIVNQLLPLDIPQVYVELFDQIDSITKQYPNSPKVIFSACGWYNDPYCKHWLAEMAEKGTLITGISHGGRIGEYCSYHVQEHEMRITDIYYTWGWDATPADKKIIKMPSPILINRKAWKTNKKKTNILWVSTATTRYCYMLPYTSAWMIQYLDWQKRFARTLSSEIRKEFKVRVLDEDYGWNLIANLKDVAPDLSFEFASSKTFKSSLQDCKLYICDHLSTTYTEALATNTPTILFWNDYFLRMHPQDEAYFQALKEVGILYDSPELAAAAIEKIYPNIEDWWNQKELQTVRKWFCDRYAKTAAQPIAEWLREFKRVSELS